MSTVRFVVPLLAILVSACPATRVGDGDPEPSTEPDPEPASCVPEREACNFDEVGSLRAPCCEWEANCFKREGCGSAVFCRAADVGAGEGSPPPDCDDDRPPGGDVGDGDGDGDIGDGDGDIGDGDGDGDIGDGDGDIGDGDGDASGLLPVAPSATQPMWVGVQTDFQVDGAPCEGRVVVAMGDQAVCLVDSLGDLLCAGRVHESIFGPTFVALDQVGVRQVLIQQTNGSVSGNGMCTVQPNREVHCFGGANALGVYGTGTAEPVPYLGPPYLAVGEVEGMATATFSSLCVKTNEPRLWCAGDGYGAAPVPLDEVNWFWENTFGELHLDNTSVFRMTPGFSECFVQADGLVCPWGSYGTPGQVVQGGLVSLGGNFPPNTAALNEPVCWLETDKTVRCSGDVMDAPATLFAEGRVLFLAINAYAASACAVYDDGALWCVGDNAQGMLGINGTDIVTVPTQMLPPGTVGVGCGGLP